MKTSNKILIIAVRGAASNMPVIPHIIPQNIKAIIIVTGCKLKVLPKNSLKFLYKFGIFINPELDDDYKKFLYARLEHILLNYDDAIVNYSKITDKNSYYDNAQYWHKRINSSQSVLKKYEDILSPLTNSTFPKNL